MLDRNVLSAATEDYVVQDIHSDTALSYNRYAFCEFIRFKASLKLSIYVVCSYSLWHISEKLHYL